MKYIDETDRAITTASRLLRVPNAKDVAEVIGELLGSAHPKLPHLRCVYVEMRAEVGTLDTDNWQTAGTEAVCVRAVRLAVHYEVPA